MQYILFLVLIISFFTTLFFIPYWIKRAKETDLVGFDVHKLDKRKVVEVGGICVVAGFVLGLLVYTGLHIFYFKSDTKVLWLMSVLAAILIVTIIGLIDDILGWKKGLKQWQKPFLTIGAALPIIAIKGGTTIMYVPFFGAVDFGLLYTLVLIPIGVIGASNAFNMLAGYNGLEAGMGAIILSTLGFISWNLGYTWVAVIAFTMVMALLAFLIYNKYPSKIFPGDTMTYSVGALIAIVAILGNIEKFALFLFIPYFLEFILKARGKFKKESFAAVQEDGSLKLKDGIYGLEHLTIKFLSKIKKKVYENDVVYALYGFEIILAIIALTLL